MVIRELNKLDLEFLIDVRNHESTRNNLESNLIFSLEECKNWFNNLTEPWFIIEVDNKRVGYIRNKNNYVGIDIHVQYRNKGYAKQAFNLFLKDKNNLKLWVFEDNFARIFYHKLGFFENGNSKLVRGRLYIEMEYHKPPKCKVAKVLSCYFGPRRHYPTCEKEAIEVFESQINAHKNLNPVVDMDLIIVNHDLGNEKIQNLLNEYDGKEISTGKINIIHRPKISNDISFASYKYAFFLFENEYDYWFFSEDDILATSNGIVPELIYLLDNDENTGFVGALKFPNKDHAYLTENDYIYSHNHIHGGVGLTSTKKIKKVISLFPEYLNTPNISQINKNISKLLNNNFGKECYNNAEEEEIKFTNYFLLAGFKLKVKKSYQNFLHIRENIKL